MSIPEDTNDMCDTFRVGLCWPFSYVLISCPIFFQQVRITKGIIKSFIKANDLRVQCILLFFLQFILVLIFVEDKIQSNTILNNKILRVI